MQKYIPKERNYFKRNNKRRQIKKKRVQCNIGLYFKYLRSYCRRADLIKSIY